MKTNYTLNRLNFFLFCIITMLAWFITYPSSFFMIEYNTNAWLIPIIMSVPIILLLLITRTENNLLYFINNNSIRSIIVRLLLFIYVIVQILLFTHYTSNILSFWYYPLNNSDIFGVILIVFTIIISATGMKTILHIGSFFSFGITLALIFSLVFIPDRDISYLLPIDTTFIKPYRLLLFIIPFCDLFLFKIVDYEFSKPINRKSLIICSLFILFFLFIFLLNSYTLVNSVFYHDIFLPSLYQFRTFPYNRYLEHFDLIIMILIVPALTFKGAFYIELVRISNGIKQCKSYFIVILIILSGFYLYTNFIKYQTDLFWNRLFIVSTILIGIIYLLLNITFKKRVTKYE